MELINLNGNENKHKIFKKNNKDKGKIWLSFIYSI